MSRKRPVLDENTTFVGILLGIVMGAIFALFKITQRGSVRRKDVAQFGAGTAELEIDANLREAKRLASLRLEDSD